MNPYVLALTSVGLTVIAQLCLKKAHIVSISSYHSYKDIQALKWLATGYIILLFVVAINALVLRVIEFNVLVALSALCYPGVVASSAFLFSEKLATRQIVALVIICAGVIIYNLR